MLRKISRRNKNITQARACNRADHRYQKLQGIFRASKNAGATTVLEEFVCLPEFVLVSTIVSSVDWAHLAKLVSWSNTFLLL
jgi:hypothetical protein